jgi:hypothetical protein
MDPKTASETLSMVKAAQAQPLPDDIAKSFTQSGTATTGITFYDLQAPALNLYPVLTPRRNKIPRVVGGRGIQANWRGVTGINTGRAGIGISEGNRGVVMAETVTEYLAAFKGFGLENSVTFEADYSAAGFQDVKALATMNLLRACMIGEEQMMLGGNSSAVALGTPATPTCTDVGTGGTLLANTAYKVIVVALTLDGYLASSVANGLPLSANRTLADGTTEAYNAGTSIQSAAGAGTTANDSNDTHSLKVSTTAIAGAMAYAWFVGTAGAEKLNQITTINSALITAPSATGGQLASAGFSADKAKNSLCFDGTLYQAFKSGSGAYVKVMATGTPGTGTPLTSDAAGGIVEIDAALQSFWDNYRLSPSIIWVSSQEMKNITAKILAGSSTAAQRFTFDTKQGLIAGGTMVRSYLNKFSMNGAVEIPIMIHPNLPAGTILFETDELPYPLSGVGMVKRMLLRRDYYQIEWPLKTRKYEYGVYADGVLQDFFTPALGVITNIAAG